jgi:uncharacterized protein (DUF1697 family)
MTHYVALPRAINAGVAISKDDLTAIATGCGFANARTFIASGNLLFESDLGEAAVKAKLEAALSDHAGKPVWTTVRTGAELAAATAANPFPGAPGNRVICLFLDAPPPDGWLEGLKHQGPDEEIVAVGREIFVRYGEGMGQSKLTFPQMKQGTGRNLNTVAKLAQMSGA